MQKIVLLSGKFCSGKSGLARRLHGEFGFSVLDTGEALEALALKRGMPTDRGSLQELGDLMDRETDFSWVFDEAKKFAETCNRSPFVVDHIRNAGQLDKFRKGGKYEVVHAHLYANEDELKKRYGEKFRRTTEDYALGETVSSAADIEEFKKDADVRINTIRSDGRDTLVRVAARLGLYSSPDVRLVDVLVGGQYGSEGKGHVAAYLAQEYDVLVRVGGPNAGHTVSSTSGVYTYHHLPSGARDTMAKLLLGPGMTIRVDRLLEEIEQCHVEADRLHIDPQAMIISEEDVQAEAELVKKIGSTGQGGGAASARRIRGRKPGEIQLARDIPALRRYVGEGPRYRGSTVMNLEIAYRAGHSILLEGTQGSGLSLFHGQFPFVTSRDTNVAGCLSEAGIPPSRVRRILLVIRPTPIRVGNPDGDEVLTSGRLKHEVSLNAIAKRAGLDVEELKALEKTSTTRRPRRIGWFEWDQFRLACELNGPTDLVLTFADYISAKNRNARRFEQLDKDTIKFVEEVERIAQAPVSLINTRFPRKENEPIDLRSVIDRRNWTGRSPRSEQ
jgi:adenylosuccinate synthase